MGSIFNAERRRGRETERILELGRCPRPQALANHLTFDRVFDKQAKGFAISSHSGHGAKPHLQITSASLRLCFSALNSPTLYMIYMFYMVKLPPNYQLPTINYHPSTTNFSTSHLFNFLTF